MAFHPENKILAFGFSGLLKFPGPKLKTKPGELEITGMALANKCDPVSFDYWKGEEGQNTLTTESITWCES